MAGKLLQEFLNAQDPIPIVAQPIPQHQWCPPEPQCYKANFDVAVFKSSNCADIGVIIRDWEGKSIRALTMTIPLSHSVVKLEALACRRAVQFALEIGLREVIFEGDSAPVIQAILTGSGDQSAYGNIIDYICCQAAALQFSNFYHVKRNCNLVTDALAKKAKNYTGLQVSLEDLPKDIVHKVFFDVH